MGMLGQRAVERDIARFLQYSMSWDVMFRPLEERIRGYQFIYPANLHPSIHPARTHATPNTSSTKSATPSPSSAGVSTTAPTSLTQTSKSKPLYSAPSPDPGIPPSSNYFSITARNQDGARCIWRFAVLQGSPPGLERSLK